MCWTRSKILTHAKEWEGSVTCTALTEGLMFPNFQDADAEAASRDGSHWSFQLLLGEEELLVEPSGIPGSLGAAELEH